MIYLLDTDTLILMIRGLKAPKKTIRAQAAMRALQKCRLVQADGHTVGLSALTVAELEFGAYHSGNYESENAAVQKVLVPFTRYGFDAVLAPIQYGRIREDLQQQGKLIESMDLLIAAHALALDATLVSNNLTHFNRVTGLKTENWF